MEKINGSTTETKGYVETLNANTSVIGLNGYICTYLLYSSITDEANLLAFLNLPALENEIDRLMAIKACVRVVIDFNAVIRCETTLGQLLRRKAAEMAAINPLKRLIIVGICRDGTVFRSLKKSGVWNYGETKVEVVLLTPEESIARLGRNSRAINPPDCEAGPFSSSFGKS